MVDKNRMKMIDGKVMKMTAQKRADEETEEILWQKALQNCKLLQPRVQDLIDTANYLLEKGLTLPDKYELRKHGYDYDSWAEGFYHGAGFVSGKRVFGSYPVAYVGILNGGACGPWDLFVSGDKLFVKNRNTNAEQVPFRQHAERFAERFPKFEKAFYDWVDNFCGK